MNLIPLVTLGAGLYLAASSREAGPESDAPRGIRNNNPGNIEKGDNWQGPGSDAPRGIRNNNPGNIEKGDNWQGLAADQSQDNRFAVFESPVYGIRAMTKILLTYRNRYGLRTPEQIISRWAPPHENDTGSYARFVADEAGIAVNDPVTDQELPRVIEAMIQLENGVQPYPAHVIREGIARAYA